MFIPLRDNIPWRRFPIVTVLIIAINFFVFIVFQHPVLSLAKEQVNLKVEAEYSTVPYRFTHPGKKCVLIYPDDLKKTDLVCQGTKKYDKARVNPKVPKEKLDQPPAWVTLFSSMFMHGGWLHIIFNMLFLWIFGNNVEDSMGRIRYIFFYLLGGLAADGLHIATNLNSTLPALGASGAIAGVLGGYARIYPRARVLSLFFLGFVFLIEVPAMVLLGFWFILQAIPGIAGLLVPELAGGVAYFAHIGGFLFGFLLIKLFATHINPKYNQPDQPPAPPPPLPVG